MFSAIKKIINPQVEAPDRRNIKILVIEDAQVDMRVAVAAIERGGFTAITAVDGQTGLQKALDENPKMIILDYNLPDINGPQVCLQLKHNPHTQHIPVLFLTSQTAPNSVMDCYEQGADNYLAKPVSPKLLLKHIEQVLKDNQEEKSC